MLVIRHFDNNAVRRSSNSKPQTPLRHLPTQVLCTDLYHIVIVVWIFCLLLGALKPQNDKWHSHKVTNFSVCVRWVLICKASLHALCSSIIAVRKTAHGVLVIVILLAFVSMLHSFDLVM